MCPVRAALHGELSVRINGDVCNDGLTIALVSIYILNALNGLSDEYCFAVEPNYIAVIWCRLAGLRI